MNIFYAKPKRTFENFRIGNLYDIRYDPDFQVQDSKGKWQVASEEDFEIVPDIFNEKVNLKTKQLK